MPRNIAEDKEKLKKKLEYIGLNLEKIPAFLKEFTPFSFRPLKSYNDIGYKVYRYVDVSEIEILLTPTDRLANINEKYKSAVPIGRYLDSKTEENLEYFTSFLSMLNNTNIEEIKQVENEQAKLKENIPYEIKYESNYIWQIYYSDVSDKYFMLVPTNEYNNSALFYLIKKKIEARKTRKKELIYIPISYQEYAGSFLVKSQIADVENYLWYFTKEWPEVYEVYNQKNKMQLKIVGKAKVYEKIQSTYVITLNSKEEAIEWYKLIKALFILATGMPEDYKFKTKINDEGELEFSYTYNNNEKIVKYSNLPEFIQSEVEQKNLLVGFEDRKIKEEQEKVKKLKEEVEKQTEDYLQKQRQIATFLECKKTFFGKVKYYFSNRKKEFQNATKNRAKRQEKVEEPKEEEINIEPATKQYTIEDLIEVCTKLDGRRKLLKNLKMDNNALELKNVNLERKIKNANIYLNEIELHKKSIFEFWKFTNKDELPSLNEGEEEQTKEKIEKTFDYELDIEDLGKTVDELQRRKLSKNETDAIFAIKQVTNCFQILNNTKSDELTEEQKQILQEKLEDLIKDYEKDIDYIKTKDFDIFGSMSEDKTKIKVLNNQKHREIEKDKYNILNITPNTELSVYIDNLRNYLNLINEAFCKISSSYTMPIYLASTEELTLDNINVFHLNEIKSIENEIKAVENKIKAVGNENKAVENEIKAIEEEKNANETIYLYKINWKANMPILYYSNIIFYDNFNQTLPLGMDVSDEVLVNLGKCKLKEKRYRRV